MNRKIRVKLIGADSHTAYIALPENLNPVEPGVVAKTVVLDKLLEYDGPRVHLDFDRTGKLIGIEVLA